jgi:Flp pilus assembly protein TadD
MGGLKKMILVPLAFMASAPAAAQYLSSNDPAPGAASLVGSNYSDAEREIRNANVSPTDPAALINLGIALAKQGEKGRAAEAFNTVLLEDNVEMVVANGHAAMSHDLARYALASLQNGALSN